MAHCKERWRNLRACLTRHLKQQQFASDGSVYHKPYYLAEHMKFLFPYTKSRPSKESAVFEGSIELDGSPQRPVKQEKLQTAVSPQKSTTDTNTTIVTTVSETDGSQFVTFVHNSNGELTEELDVTAHTQPHHQQLHIEEASITEQKAIETAYHTNNATTIQETYEPIGSSIKRMKMSISQESDDADLNFFKSLLPDIRLMTASQKRRFKMGIFGLIDNVLTNNESNT